MSPVRPTVEETDVDDLLGADDGTTHDRILLEVIRVEGGDSVFLFNDGTYERFHATGSQ